MSYEGDRSPEEIQQFEQTRIHNPEVAHEAADHTKNELELALQNRKNAALYREIGEDKQAQLHESKAAEYEENATEEATNVQLADMREDIGEATLKEWLVRIKFEISDLESGLQFFRELDSDQNNTPSAAERPFDPDRLASAIARRVQLISLKSKQVQLTQDRIGALERNRE